MTQPVNTLNKKILDMEDRGKASGAAVYFYPGAIVPASGTIILKGEVRLQGTSEKVPLDRLSFDNAIVAACSRYAANRKAADQSGPHWACEYNPDYVTPVPMPDWYVGARNNVRSSLGSFDAAARAMQEARLQALESDSTDSTALAWHVKHTQDLLNEWKIWMCRAAVNDYLGAENTGHYYYNAEVINALAAKQLHFHVKLKTHFPYVTQVSYPSKTIKDKIETYVYPQPRHKIRPTLKGVTEGAIKTLRGFGGSEPKDADFTLYDFMTVKTGGTALTKILKSSCVSNFPVENIARVGTANPPVKVPINETNVEWLFPKGSIVSSNCTTHNISVSGVGLTYSLRLANMRVIRCNTGGNRAFDDGTDDDDLSASFGATTINVGEPTGSVASTSSAPLHHTEMPDSLDFD